jgi:hypothetical protein
MTGTTKFEAVEYTHSVWRVRRREMDGRVWREYTAVGYFIGLPAALRAVEAEPPGRYMVNTRDGRTVSRVKVGIPLPGATERAGG